MSVVLWPLAIRDNVPISRGMVIGTLSDTTFNMDPQFILELWNVVTEHMKVHSTAQQLPGGGFSRIRLIFGRGFRPVLVLFLVLVRVNTGVVTRNEKMGRESQTVCL